MDTHPRTKASEEPKSHHQINQQRTVLNQRFKLLVVSDVPRRNELLSSNSKVMVGDLACQGEDAPNVVSFLGQTLAW